MNSLHVSQSQASNENEESVKMQTLRKEVIAACTAIIIASTPISSHASDTYVNGIVHLDNRSIPTFLSQQNGQIIFPSPYLSPNLIADNSKLELPAKVTNPPQAKLNIEQVETGIKSPLRSATVVGSMSVEKFMLDNFGTKDGWELLVDAGTVGRKGGDRVRKANRDLYRGHTYFLARSAEEADMISKIVREKSQKKLQQISQSGEKIKNTTPKAKKETKKTYVITRPSLDDEANEFLTNIAKKDAYNDTGAMYEYRLGEDERRAILKKVGLSDIHMPVISTLMFKLAKDESGLNYGAFGPVIRHKSSHQGHRAIGIVQIMPINWVNWSKKHFGTILEPTDTNQEKVGFAQIAEYYKAYIEKGYSLKQITEKLAISWYGSIKVDGLISPSKYAQRFINSVFSDIPRVTEAKKILASLKKGIHIGDIQAKSSTIPNQKDTRVIETSSKKAIQEKVAVTTANITHAPAVNDPLYFKSSPLIVSGMNKVIDLGKYLQDKTLNRESEKAFKTRLPVIGNTISACQKELTNPANKTDLKFVIQNQIELGNAITEALTLAHGVVPNTAFANGIDEAKTKMAKVLNFQVALEKSLAQKAKQKAEEQRQARIAALQIDSVRFAERALGLKAA